MPKTKTKSHDYMTTAAAAQALGLSQRTVQRFVRDGVLEFFQYSAGRRIYVKKSDVIRLKKKASV
jgi:excisionase family DNA binding protein